MLLVAPNLNTMTMLDEKTVIEQHEFQDTAGIRLTYEVFMKSLTWWNKLVLIVSLFKIYLAARAFMLVNEACFKIKFVARTRYFTRERAGSIALFFSFVGLAYFVNIVKVFEAL